MVPEMTAEPSDASAFVSGEPALLLSRSEREWRDAVSGCGLVELTTPRLRFVVSSWRRYGNRFDLDNLVDPVLGVVGADRSLLRSVWATVEVGPVPGVEIGEAAVPPAPAPAVRVHLASAPRRSVRSVERLVELEGHEPVGVDAPCGCSITLGPETDGIVFGFEGPVKPTIDALWPLLGGAAHAPADHRIQDLRVCVDDTVGVEVAVWELES
jgi:hypothetical protein